MVRRRRYRRKERVRGKKRGKGDTDGSKISSNDR